MTWKERPYSQEISHCLEFMKLFKGLLEENFIDENILAKTLIYLYPDLYLNNPKAVEERIENIKTQQTPYNAVAKERVDYIREDLKALKRIILEEVL